MNFKFSFLSILFVFFAFLLSAQDLTTKQAPLPCLDKQFSIVAHIVRDTFGGESYTEADILAGITKINELFSAICVSFEVCEYRYIDNFQYYVGNHWDEIQMKYNQENRINMYFGISNNSNPAYCTFSTQGGISLVDQGGIFIRCNSWQAMAHGMGHYFGLLDTYRGSGTELVDGSNCETEGDEICDTPADPFVAGEQLIYYLDVFNTCRFNSPKVDANGQFYEPDVGNIMSAYQCACGFTYQQYLRMANTCQSGASMW